MDVTGEFETLDAAIDASRWVYKKDSKRKTHSFQRIMWAMHKVYDSIDDDVGRLILKHPSLAQGKLLKMIGGMGQSALIASKLFAHVLQPSDYTTTLHLIRDVVYNEDGKICKIVEHFERQKVKRLTLEQLINLVANSSSLSLDAFTKQLRDAEWFSNIVKSSKINAKIRTSLDSETLDVISAKVKGFLDAEPELLKWYTVADSWKAHFDDCLADQGFYKPTPYQMYVAATICKAIAKGDQNKFVMKLGAGQGKTLVYLLVCLMLSKNDETGSTYKKFMVMTSVQALYNQLGEIKRKHKIPSNIEFMFSERLFTLDASQADLYILDEADWLTRTIAVKFNMKNQLQGFYQLLNKKFLLCSATFSNFESEIV